MEVTEASCSTFCDEALREMDRVLKVAYPVIFPVDISNPKPKRFKSISEEDLNELQDNKESKSTKKNTKWSISVLKGFDENIKAADNDLKEANAKYEQLQEEVDTAIKVVREIASEIQKQEDISRIGGIVYGGTGLVSGGLFIAGLVMAPFTAGLSLAATAGGAALGASSAVAGVTHGIVKDKIVKSGFDEATKIMESISKKWEELHTLLEAVVRRLDKVNPCVLKIIFDPDKVKSVGKGVATGYSMYKASKALVLLRRGHFEKLQNFLCIGKFANQALSKVGSRVGVNLVRTTRGITKVANKVMVPLAIFGAVLDVKDIVENSIKISKEEKNEIAKALNENADQMAEEMKKLSELFED